MRQASGIIYGLLCVAIKQINASSDFRMKADLHWDERGSNVFHFLWWF